MITNDTPPSERPSQDMLAAEYVLGTLDPAERDEARALLASDPEFAVLVGQWERRLGELHALEAEVDPPDDTWAAIKAQLVVPSSAAIAQGADLSRGAPPADVVHLGTRMARWRRISAVTGSIAAVLTALIVTSAVAPATLPQALQLRLGLFEKATPAQFVAVLQRDAAAPAFFLTVDVANRSFTVRRVAAEAQAGKSYELWLVSNRFPAPRSLGLVSGTEFTQSANLRPYDASTINDSSFAVSLEPEGGSPTGAPSNVLFIGKLIESVPPPN